MEELGCTGQCQKETDGNGHVQAIGRELLNHVRVEHLVNHLVSDRLLCGTVAAIGLTKGLTFLAVWVTSAVGKLVVLTVGRCTAPTSSTIGTAFWLDTETTRVLASGVHAGLHRQTLILLDAFSVAG